MTHAPYQKERYLQGRGELRYLPPKETMEVGPAQRLSVVGQPATLEEGLARWMYSNNSIVDFFLSHAVESPKILSSVSIRDFVPA